MDNILNVLVQKNILNVVPRQKYCESLHKTVRRKTRTVNVGDVTIGSDHPIRIQTMTTTDTKDVAGTVEQVTQLFFCSLLIAQASSQFTI